MTLNTHKPIKPIIFEDLTAKLVRGKFGEYTYRAPNFYTKQAHKFNLLVYIYIGDKWLETKGFKDTTRKKILDFLKEYKKSSRYLRAVKHNVSIPSQHVNAQLHCFLVGSKENPFVVVTPYEKEQVKALLELSMLCLAPFQVTNDCSQQLHEGQHQP